MARLRRGSSARRSLWRLVVGLAVVTLASLVTGASPAAAGTSASCACADVSWDDELAGADTVFAGSLSPLDDAGHVISGGRLQWSFLVDRVYKGSAVRATGVVTVDETASCGDVFTPQVDYLIVGQVEDASRLVMTGACAGSQSLDAVSAASLSALGSGNPPGAVWPGLSATPDKAGLGWRPVAVVIVFLAAGLTLLFSGTRASRHRPVGSSH